MGKTAHCLPKSNGEVSCWLVFTPCLYDDSSYDCAEGLTFCKMLHDLSSIAATWQRYICLADLGASTLTVVAVFDNCALEPVQFQMHFVMQPGECLC